MKKFLSFFLSGIVFVVVLLLAPNTHQSASASELGVSGPEQILKTKKQSLHYQDTISTVNPCVSPFSDRVLSNEKLLDVYTDASNNRYYFRKGTDSLCGYQKEYYYGIYTENPVGETQALRIAQTYLSRLVPEFSDYTLLLVQYSECDLVYQIQYSYEINGIPSDDLIHIYIQANGEVGAFMMQNRGAYRNLRLDLQLAKNYLVAGENPALISQYITETEEGLLLVQNYLTADEQGGERVEQTALPLR